ncbi:hypothetical protein OIE66_00735 [Nonomuraea sp. NBC_01738]|uniref:hypothetical protein n=1 Tax=Nonomuraea sp. NBC_01738 TaxID=2976003 RepID=UPI002E0D9D75|nr:hypothetical protein OIE66_00735 [Nonomuraea sp. NBC_01738]
MAPRSGRLSLAGNGIAPAAMAQVIAAATRAGLETLDLGRVPAAGFLGASDNHLDPPFAIQAARSLSELPHRLTHLDLRHTGLTSRAALHLLDGARRAATPTRYVLGNGIASRVKRDLRELAAAVPALRPHPRIAAAHSVHRTARTSEQIT